MVSSGAQPAVRGHEPSFTHDINSIVVVNMRERAIASTFPISTDRMRTEKTMTRQTDTDTRRPSFLVGQILLPTLMFATLCGFFRYEFILIVAPLLVYSIARIAMLLYKRQYTFLLRPGLTATFALIFICVWQISARQADVFVQHLAREIQAQCNRDRICRVPPGDWRPTSNSTTVFTSRAPGIFPMRMMLSFDDYVALESKVKQRCDQTNTTIRCRDDQSHVLPFTTFRLAQLREDGYPPIYGGVGHSLHTPTSTIYD